MKRHFFFRAALAVLILDAAVLQCQQLTIEPETGKQTILTKTDIESMPRVKVATGPPDSPTIYEGVTVKALLERAGVEFGESLRGKRLASCVLVEAADGYRVVIALPEIDPAFSDKKIVLAFLEDGKPLDAKAGPYRIIIPDEQRMARWVRQVTTLKIVDVQ
jgi:hypothetical protein